MDEADAVIEPEGGAPDAADENERLIRGVFAELAAEKPDGLQ